MTLRTTVLASGRGSNLQALLSAIQVGLVDAEVTLVVSDRPAAPCLHLASEGGVPAVLELVPGQGESRSRYGSRLLEALQSERPDLIVLAGFMRILSPELVAAFPRRIINIHPALLPAFKGAHGIRDTLRGGAKLAGCTTHFVTADLDGGPIILQAAVAVKADDDKDRLAARVLRLEHQILPRTVQLIAEERIRFEDGRAVIAPGPSWHGRVAVVPGALYPDGF